MNSLRRYLPEDVHELLAWRNHPETRRWSFSSQVIPFAEHEAWFRRFLADPRKLGFMLLDEGKPVAQIRFEPAALPGTLTISISVHPGNHGKGLGKRILALALEHPDVARQAAMVRAETFVDNLPSQKIFLATGFREITRGTRDGKEFIEWRRPVGDALFRVKFGIAGEGPLFDAAMAALRTFDVSPAFVLRPSVAGASAEDLVAALEEQAGALPGQSLVVADWPGVVQGQATLEATFPAGTAIFRTGVETASDKRLTDDGNLRIIEMTPEICPIHLWMFLAFQAFRREARE